MGKPLQLVSAKCSKFPLTTISTIWCTSVLSSQDIPTPNLPTAQLASPYLLYFWTKQNIPKTELFWTFAFRILLLTFIFRQTQRIKCFQCCCVWKGMGKQLKTSLLAVWDEYTSPLSPNSPTFDTSSYRRRDDWSSLVRYCDDISAEGSSRPQHLHSHSAPLLSLLPPHPLKRSIRTPSSL